MSKSRSRGKSYHNNDFKQIIEKLESKKNVIVNRNLNVYIKYSLSLKKANSLEALHQLLDEMLNKDLFPDSVIVNQVIKKLGHYRLVSYACGMHRIAVSKGFANAITYNSTIDAIAKSREPDENEGMRLLEELKKILNFPVMSPDTIINLHDLSFGAVYFWLKNGLTELINKSGDQVKIALIYGKGLHSQGHQETHAIKQAVIKVMEEMKGNIFRCEEDHQNPGRFNVTLQQKKLAEQSSEIKALTAKLFKPLSSNMNPHATPFRPRLVT